MNNLFSQSLKIENISPEIKQFILDAMEDAFYWTNKLIEWSGRGYLTISGDKTIKTSPQESFSLRKQQFGSNDVLIQTLVDTVIELKKDSSFYGLFYSDYKPKNILDSKSIEGKLIKGKLQDNNWKTKPIDKLSDEEFLELKNKYKGVLKDTLDDYRLQLSNGKNRNELWKEISEKIGSQSNIANCIRSLKDVGLEFKVKHPNNKCYCTAIAQMIRSRFTSWIESDVLFNKEMKALEDRSNPSYPDVFNAIQLLENDMNVLGGKLSKYDLTKTLFAIKQGREIHPRNKFLFELITNKYSLLLTANEKELKSSCNTLRICQKLHKKREKSYISKPKSSKYLVPFGLTGTGLPYKIKSDKFGKVVVSINGKDQIICKSSNYFNDLKFFDGKDQNRISFMHNKKRFVNAVVKQINVYPGEEWYLHIPYWVECEDDSYNLKWFFSSADKKKIDSRIKTLPSRFIGLGIDLGITNPICITAALLEKNDFSKQIRSPFYGSGCILTQPEILSGKTKLGSEIYNLIQKLDMLKEIIRESRVCHKHKEKICDESSSFLLTETGNHKNLYQNVMLCVKKYKKERNALYQKSADIGHNDLHVLLLLIKLEKTWRSCRNAYDNISSNNNKEHIYFRKYDEQLSNSRDSLSKKIGNIIQQYAFNLKEKYNIPVVCFVEDLEMKPNEDQSNKDNSLSALFSPGQLKSKIENSLNQIGVATVWVEPTHTSQFDSLTGNFGARVGEKLYVKRDGKIGEIHADLNASLNVLKAGLNHSSFCSKIYINSASKLIDDEDKESDKRKKLFIKFNNLGNYFLLEEGVVKNINKKSKTVLNSQYLYLDSAGKFMTKHQKETQAKIILARIKDMRDGGEQIEKFDITSENISRYKAFDLALDT